MSKRNKSIVTIWIIIILMLVFECVYYINHAIDYRKRVNEGNARWNQVEDRIVNVENRLDNIETRVDKIEKEL